MHPHFSSIKKGLEKDLLSGTYHYQVYTGNPILIHVA